jgi:hypothetical protein
VLVPGFGIKRATPAQLALVLVGFVAMAGLSFGLAKTLYWLHWYPLTPPAMGAFRTRAAPFLLVLPALFASVGPGLLVSNLVAWLIRPWRRILDREAEQIPGGDYGSSQVGIMKATVVILVVTTPFMVAGVLLGR